MAPALADSPAPGTSAESPIVVTDVSEVPEGAVEDIPSTYMTDNECATTRSWVLTIPGEHHDAVTQVQNQWVRWVEGTEEVSHEVWTLYKQTGEYYPEELAFWATFAPNETEGPYTGTPEPPANMQDWERDYGKWVIHEGDGGPGPEEPGLYNPSESGLGSWFYRHAYKAAWTDWSGEWVVHETGVGEPPELPEDTKDVKWKIEVETVIDVPATEGYFEYYVEDGEPTTDEDLASWIPEGEDPGEGWDIHATRTVTIEEAYTDPDVVTYFAWTDDKPCEDTEKPEEPTTPTLPDTPEKPAQALPPAGASVDGLGLIGALFVLGGAALVALRKRVESN